MMRHSNRLAPPPELAALQREFQDYVLQRDPAVLQRVRSADPDQAVSRMNVYADGYVTRLLEALETDYPGLKAIAGVEDFERLGRAYIAAHPSSVRNLRWYAARLAPFLAQSPDWSDRPQLSEMARFEWAMAASFDALDAACLSRDALTGLAPDTWPRLTFIVHPAVRRIELATNVPLAWSAQARGDPLPALHTGAQPTVWLLTRRNLQVRFRPMASDEAAAFDRLVVARAGFERWCDQLGEVVGEEHAPLRAVELLTQWLADGALAGFALEPASA